MPPFLIFFRLTIFRVFTFIIRYIQIYTRVRTHTHTHTHTRSKVFSHIRQKFLTLHLRYECSFGLQSHFQRMILKEERLYLNLHRYIPTGHVLE